jgi:hypothetical protein
MSRVSLLLFYNKKNKVQIYIKFNPIQMQKFVSYDAILPSPRVGWGNNKDLCVWDKIGLYDSGERFGLWVYCLLIYPPLNL